MERMAEQLYFNCSENIGNKNNEIYVYFTVKLNQYWLLCFQNLEELNTLIHDFAQIVEVSTNSGWL